MAEAADVEQPSVALTESVPAPWLPRAARLALTMLVLTHVLLSIAVVVGLATGAGTAMRTIVVVVLIACAAAEFAVTARSAFGAWVFHRAGLGTAARMAVRATLVVSLVVASADGERGLAIVVVVAAVALPLAVVASAGIADLVARVRQLPVTSRGLEVGLAQPPLPHRWVNGVRGRPLDVLVLATGLVVAGGSTDSWWPVSVVAVAGVVALAAPAAAGVLLVRCVVRSRRVDAARATAAVEAALDRVRPDVALYYAGPAEAVYQVAMWLPTFERLAADTPGRRTVVVVRNARAMAAIPPTTLPVVCAERGNTLLQLQWPRSLRLACYVSNASGNIHLLRERSMRHVFIGHGDSDKTVSTGRYAKVYDEIWEAGPAGRERWRTADVGVSDEQVVEVGAPFLDRPASAGPTTGATTAGVPLPPPATGARTTIAYTPTWEGVADGADASSLGPCGEAAVRRLLDLGVRVLYRPHPLAGTRDSRTAQAHARVLAMLDLGEQDAAVPDPLHTGGHLYSPSRVATLGQVLMAADGAITDISAALSELLAIGIPAAVTDPAGLPESVLVERFPTAASAYVVGPDGAGVDVLVGAVRGSDPLAAARAAARTWLFGVDPAEPVDGPDSRFPAAVEAALGRRLPERRTPSVSGGPPRPAPSPPPA